MNVADNYRPAPRFVQLGEKFFDEVDAAVFPELTLRFRNQTWSKKIGLHELTDAQWQQAFGRFVPLPDNLLRPLALRYHGHQFQSYNPDLGDGRGFLYAQLIDDRDRLLDLATKGSGQTPWSRAGDGRLTLKGGVREILATEMLEALGVNTSKSLSLFETGESLARNDEPSPTRASVLVRLGHSHIRFGSFQRMAFHGDHESLQALVGFSLAHYSPFLCHRGDSPTLLLQQVVHRSAQLCAGWMVAGFVHGVLNTDNMNITGESFDYGPFRFLPTLDPTFTAAYFDHSGLYAYGNQPTTVGWNLQQLARALEPIAVASTLREVLGEYGQAFELALDQQVVRRLGVVSRGPLHDRLLRTSVLAFLQDSQIGFERFFFDWYGGAAAAKRVDRSPHAADYNSSGASDLRHDLAQTQPNESARLNHAYFRQESPCTMLIEEVEAIWERIDRNDDWSRFDDKIESIRQMADALTLSTPS